MFHIFACIEKVGHLLMFFTEKTRQETLHLCLKQFGVQESKQEDTS